MGKRILVVASTFPASDDDPVPAFVKDQIIALKEQTPDFEFSVLAPHDKRSHTETFVRHTTYDEYRFHYMWPYSVEQLAGRGIMPALKANPLNYLLIPFLFVGEFFALLRLTRQLKPDVIYAHWFTPQAINSRLVSSLTGTPFVFTTHASDVDVWRKIPYIGKKIVRNNTRKAVRFTAVSRRSMQKLANFFTESEWTELKKRSSIIPMGVTLPTVSVKKKTAGKKLTITFLGRLAEKKGVQYLLPAFAELLKDHKDITLIIAGDGPLRGDLQQQASKLKIAKNVMFPGFTSGSAKENLLVSTDIFVVPSIITDSGDAEGLPVSLMEGLAYGNICIASNESGADDILTDGKDGFLVPQKDTDALATTLSKAVQMSTEERLQMSKNAQATSLQFSWKSVAEKHRKFLFRKG